MDESELISIIVPIYNIERYLPKCLDTISRQTYQNLEIILIDDGSTDNSGSICDEFAKKDSRAIVIHQQNGGQGNARNVGQRIAKGNYIMFVDGDDYLHSDALRIMHEAINTKNGYDIVEIGWKPTQSDKEDIESRVYYHYKELTQEELLGRIHLPNVLWDKLFRRRVIKDIWAKGYAIAEDCDYIIRAYLNVEKAILIDQCLYYYTQRPDSILNSPKANIIGPKCVTQIMYDNLTNDYSDKKHLQHYLLKQLYTNMCYLINNTWNTEDKETIQNFCKHYERLIRKTYWNNRYIGFVEKVAMTTNVLYPGFIRTTKRISNGMLSWHIFSKF